MSAGLTPAQSGLYIGVVSYLVLTMIDLVHGAMAIDSEPVEYALKAMTVESVEHLR